MLLPPLNLPDLSHKVQHNSEESRIFDIVRKKYVCLTSEEWVRQHWVHYLVHHLGYPVGLVSLERTIRCKYRLQHRPDIVVYDQAGKPQLLVECKSPQVTLSIDTLGQLARYSAYIRPRILVVSNGIQHFCWQIDAATATLKSLSNVPQFSMLQG